MYNILPESKDNIIVICIQEHMNSQDTKTLLPYLRQRIAHYGKIRLLVELKNFSGIQMGSLLKTLSFSFTHGKGVEKKAIIADERWVYTWIHLFSTLSKTEIRCFPSRDREKAREWLRK